MNDRTPSRSPFPWAVLLALLLLPAQASLSSAVAPGATAVATVRSPGHPGAAPRVALFGDLRSLFSDRDTMIQVGVVVGAIAIFLLTRSTK